MALSPAAFSVSKETPLGTVPPSCRPELSHRIMSLAPSALVTLLRCDSPGRYEGGNGSGSLATGGGLVFQANPAGALIAYDARNGRKLWEGAVGAGAASPVSYEIDGRQFVAILGGRGGPNGDPARLTTFSLGR